LFCFEACRRTAARAAQTADSPAAPAQRQPPQRSGSWCGIPVRYDIKSIIGKGAYGTVCEAYDRTREEQVAVKQVRGLFNSLPSCKRTLREIAILAALDHDCVMKVHDIFVPRDEVDTFSELYIVMELCDTDLRKLVALDMVLTTEHITWLMYNLMRGVAYLHSVGVCHRDLKPANCLVNQHCTVKITDFNLSCIIGGDDGENGPARPPSPSSRRARWCQSCHKVKRTSVCDLGRWLSGRQSRPASKELKHILC